MLTATYYMMQQYTPPRPVIHPDETRWNPIGNEVAPNCPRCASTNTKFCYYNNYSLSQPRYFCKGCRRYWTKGGSLRNVPVGGGCRRSRRATHKSLRPSYDNTKDDKRLHLVDPSPLENNHNGSDIDMAIVFANFLNNKNPGFDQPDDQLLSDQELLPLRDNVVASDSFNSSTVTGENEEVLDSRLLADQEKFEEFMGNEFALNDEVIQDVLWSDDTGLANFSWQMQDLDSFTPQDDRLKIKENLMHDDNWNSLDLSGFDLFSEP